MERKAARHTGTHGATGDHEIAAAHTRLVAHTSVALRDLALDPGNELAAGDPTTQHDASGDPHAGNMVSFVRAFVPMRAYERLCSHGIAGLQSRIEKMPATLAGRILVREAPGTDDGTHRTYVVIDGSWHVAALRHLAEHGTTDGGSVAPDVAVLFEACPVTVVLPGTDPAVVLALLADPVHNHRDTWVRGQRDRLLAHLGESGTRHSREAVTETLGTDHHALRRYHAYLALQQMMQGHSLAVQQAADLYPLFYAAVGRPVIREWLDWDDHLWRFLDDINLGHFHRLLAPRPQPDGSVHPACIRTVEDIVHLCDVIGDQEALRLLLHEDGTLQDAVDFVNAGLFHHMTTAVSDAIGTMQWDRRRFDRRST